MKRSNERLIQLARSVNDNVVGTHIGQLCRDMADQLEMMRAAAKGSLMIVEIAIALRREAEKKASDLGTELKRRQSERDEHAAWDDEHVRQLNAAEVRIAVLEKALERIAVLPDCGCKPCTGQCRSQAVLLIELEEIRALAAVALAAEQKDVGNAKL